MNKSFIFDRSWTLSNNFDCFFKVCNTIFKELDHKPISKEEIKLNFTIPYMNFWNKYIPELSKEKQDLLYEKYIHRVWKNKLYPNVKKVIKKLHLLKAKIYIVSSDPISKLTIETEDSWLKELFEKIIWWVYNKSDSISSIINEFDLDKNNVYYIWDTSGDIESGKSVGIKTIWISRWFQDKNILKKSKPDFIIDDIKEILVII